MTKSPQKPLRPITSLDKLLSIDNKLKALPILAAILQHNNNQNIMNFDLRDFVVNIRRNSALADAFAGENFYKQKDKLENTKSQWTFFNKQIRGHDLNRTVDHIFSFLYDQSFFINPPPKQLGRDVIEIEKNPQYIRDNPYCIGYLSNLLLEINNRIQRDTIHPTNDPSKWNIITYKKRIEESCVLYDELKDNNHVEYLKNNFSSSPYAININSILTLPFVGTIRDKEYQEETVIFFFCHYKFENEITLNEADIQIKNTFKVILEKNPVLQHSIKNCAGLSTSNEGVLTTLLTRIPNSNQVSVICFLHFFKDKFFQRYRFPLYSTKDYVQNTLGWEVLCNNMSYIPIKIL